jgi:hypothetical protein
MATLTLADYQSYQDGPTEGLRWRFNLPDNFVKGTNRAIPALMFRVDADGDCNVWVHVNDSAEEGTLRASSASIQLKVRGGHGQKTVHELLGGTGFRVGQENLIVISKAPGDEGATLWISDIVLFYQVRVTI